MDREGARRRMVTALREYVVLGITTNIPFLIDVLNTPAFADGALHTHFLEDHLPKWSGMGAQAEIAALAAAVHSALAPARGNIVAGAPAARPTPWLSLGAWRVGQQASS